MTIRTTIRTLLVIAVGGVTTAAVAAGTVALTPSSSAGTGCATTACAAAPQYQLVSFVTGRREQRYDPYKS